MMSSCALDTKNHAPVTSLMVVNYGVNISEHLLLAFAVNEHLYGVWCSILLVTC